MFRVATGTVFLLLSTSLAKMSSYLTGCAVLNLFAGSASGGFEYITLFVDCEGELVLPFAATETERVTGLFEGPYFCANILFKSSVGLLSKGLVSVSC